MGIALDFILESSLGSKRLYMDLMGKPLITYDINFGDVCCPLSTVQERFVMVEYCGAYLYAILNFFGKQSSSVYRKG